MTAVVLVASMVTANQVVAMTAAQAMTRTTLVLLVLLVALVTVLSIKNTTNPAKARKPVTVNTTAIAATLVVVAVLVFEKIIPVR